MNPEIEALAKKISPARFAKMLRVLESRTLRLSVVLEDVYQPHNAAAVLRNCDAFGVQEVSIIENKYICRISGSVDMGASKWLTLRRYTSPEAVVPKNGISEKHLVSPAASANTLRALGDIKSRGYFLAAASLKEGAGSIDDIPADRPIALMIGTELTGLSEAAHSRADFVFSMPMLGFAQSFNLSVFSALCLWRLSSKMRALGDSWRLSRSEKEKILLRWLGAESQK